MLRSKTTSLTEYFSLEINSRNDYVKLHSNLIDLRNNIMGARVTAKIYIYEN